MILLLLAAALLPVGAKGQLQDVWVLGMSPFTGGLWDAGESVRVAADMMAQLINQEATVLPGYRLRVLWQDDHCSGTSASNLLMDNLLRDRYIRYPSLPHNDTDGDGRISTSETASREVILGPDDVKPKPIAILAGGCSVTSIALVRWAYSFRIPLISPTNTRPGLSDRSVYPNYFRVITQEGTAPEVMFTFMKMVGLQRTILVVGDEGQFSMLPIFVEQAWRFNISLVGPSLDLLSPGLRGVQLTSISWPQAMNVIQVIRGRNVRAVIHLMYADRFHLLACAQVSAGFGALLWFSYAFDPNLWTKQGLSAAEGAYPCTTADILGVLNGMIIVIAAVFRIGPEEGSLTCSSTKDVQAFKEDFFAVQGSEVDVYAQVPDHYTVMAEAPAAADAVCMIALMLRGLLFSYNYTVEEVAARTPQVYEDMVTLLENSDFTGVWGRLQFSPGSADPSLSRQQLIQLQAPRTPCTGAGACGAPALAVSHSFALFERGLIYFRGTGNISFHFSDEVFPLPPSGSTYITASLHDFEECAEGQTYNPQARECQNCGLGQVFYSATGTCVCRPGFRRSASQCVACPAGTYSDNVDAAACLNCPIGRYSPTTGTPECTLCRVGTFADTPGQKVCTLCGQGKANPDLWSTMRLVPMMAEQGKGLQFEWNYAEGATSSEQCGCDMFARNDSVGECKECEEGLICTGMGEVTVMEGYYSARAISVYKCHGRADQCQGGLPGEVCAEGREGLACASCKLGYSPGEGGTCVPCTSSHLVFLAVLTFGFLMVLTGCYFLIGRSHTRRVEVINLVICFGLLLTAVQIFSLMGTFEFVRTQPLEYALALIHLIGALNPDILQGSCVDISPLGRFCIKLSIILIACLWLLFVHCLTCIAWYPGQVWERRHTLKRVCGTVVLAFYLSIVSAMLMPLQCEEHPNTKQTVHAYPSVLCWESQEHLNMVILGVVAFLCIPVPHVVRCALVVHRFPLRMRMADVRFLDENTYLFIRFRPEAYWYSLVIMARSLMCASLVVWPNTVVQVILLQFFMIASLLCGIHFVPWRTPLANVLEVIVSSLMVVFGAFASVQAQATKDDVVVLSYMCTAVIIAVVTPFPVYTLWVAACRLFRTHRRFQFFLCHHKAGAGAFTRLLKLCLLESPHVTREVFIDSDNLENLSMLFSLLCTSADNLIIVASRFIFQRPWCVGEMTVARTHGIQSRLVTLPDTELPSQEFIDSIATLIDDPTPLAAEGIDVEAIQETLVWIHSLDSVALGLPLNRYSVHDLTAEICRMTIQKTVSSQNRFGVSRTLSKFTATHTSSSGSNDRSKASARVPGSCVGVLCHPFVLEAVAAAHVLQKLMAPCVGHNANYLPSVLMVDRDLPMNLQAIVILLSAGIFEQDWVLRTLVEAGYRGLRVLPVQLDDSFHFPSPTELEDMWSLKGPPVGSVVAQTMSEICIPFQPQRASLDALQVGAREVARRLLACQSKVLLLSTDEDCWTI